MLSAVRAMAARVAHDLAHMDTRRLGPDVTAQEQDELLAEVLENALEAGKEAVERFAVEAVELVGDLRRVSAMLSPVSPSATGKTFRSSIRWREASTAVRAPAAAARARSGRRVSLPASAGAGVREGSLMACERYRPHHPRGGWRLSLPQSWPILQWFH